MNADHNTGFQEQRRKRLEWLANYLLQVIPSEGLRYGQIRAKLLSKWGLTSEKTDEYLQIIIETCGLELREGRIFKARSGQLFGD